MKKLDCRIIIVTGTLQFIGGTARFLTLIRRVLKSVLVATLVPSEQIFDELSILAPPQATRESPNRRGAIILEADLIDLSILCIPILYYR